jgi:hypothetical protein
MVTSLSLLIMPTRSGRGSTPLGSGQGEKGRAACRWARRLLKTRRARCRFRSRRRSTVRSNQCKPSPWCRCRNNRRSWDRRTCGGGGIGRRRSLRWQREQSRGGSSPLIRTIGLKDSSLKGRGPIFRLAAIRSEPPREWGPRIYSRSRRCFSEPIPASHQFAEGGRRCRT